MLNTVVNTVNQHSRQLEMKYMKGEIIGLFVYTKFMAIFYKGNARLKRRKTEGNEFVN